MGGTQRLAAVAAVSHARGYYNVTHNTETVRADPTQYGINIFFISATLCGIMIAACAACWPRAPFSDKSDDAHDCTAHVYTVSDDDTLRDCQFQDTPPGPPPAYESVVDTRCNKDNVILQEVVIEPNMVPFYPKDQRPDSGLPSYEAAVLLRDTKL